MLLLFNDANIGIIFDTYKYLSNFLFLSFHNSYFLIKCNFVLFYLYISLNCCIFAPK